MKTILKSLRVVNFVEYDDFKVNFHPNVNFIIGISGSGKTTLFQAINLIADNSPSKPRQMLAKDKNKDFRIELDTNIAKIIRTEKKYKIIWPNKTEQEFVAFGKDIPKPIKQILNLKSVNWQWQFFPHYITLDKGSSVAKELSKELGTEDSEKVIKELKLEISTNKSNYRNISAELENVKSTITKLKPVKDFVEEFSELQQYVVLGEAKQKELKVLNLLLNDITIAQDNLQSLEPINLFLKEIDKIKKKLIIKNQLEGEIKEFENILTVLNDIVLIDISLLNTFNKELNDFEELLEEKNELTKEIFTLSKLINDIKTLKIKNMKQKLELTKLQNEFNLAIKVCPLCGREG